MSSTVTAASPSWAASFKRTRESATRPTGEALVDHGIEPDASLVFETADNLEGTGEEAGRAMLAAGMPSTAAFAATDYNALGLMRALSEAGLDLPDDQAVVGFDDVEASSSIRPTLSTVRQTFNAAGRLAATLILDLVAGREVAPEVHRVPTSFVIRESCGCATGSALEMVGDADPSLPTTPKDRLRFRLQRLLNGIEPLPAEQSAALDVAVEAIARCAQMGGEGDQTSGCAHREAARALFSISPRWTTITASVNCVRRYWLELEADREPAEDASHPQADITEILVELSRLLAQRELTASTVLNLQMRREHQLSMALVSGSTGDPRSLGWLDHTTARLGCLGLWSADREEGGERQHLLTMTGAYAREGPPFAQSPDQVRVERLPPHRTPRERAVGARRHWNGDAHQDQRHGSGADGHGRPGRGHPGHGRDLHFESSALVSVAVEREVMTEWLRSQTEDLARAYKRERDLVEEIQRSEERYALAARAANDGLWDWDLGTSSVLLLGPVEDDARPPGS